jgi:hypothetical protein
MSQRLKVVIGGGGFGVPSAAEQRRSHGLQIQQRTVMNPNRDRSLRAAPDSRRLRICPSVQCEPRRGGFQIASSDTIYGDLTSRVGTASRIL